MITNAHKISHESPEFRAAFQLDVLQHWHDIKGEKFLPNKRDFRPQNFPKYLGQLAIISVDDDGSFFDRLTGGTICDVLKLAEGTAKLLSSADPNVRDTVCDMLKQTQAHAGPMYFTGQLAPANRPHADFTSLVVPFSENEGMLTSFILAFDFTRHAGTNLFAIS